jgi:hypothetical protein
MSEHYKRRIVDPRAYELTDGSGWTAEVYVAENDGADILDTQYLLKETFSTKESAMTAALQAGRNVIDKRD